MVDGEWLMDDGKAEGGRMNAEWQMANGKSQMANGRW
jgi:hypothetical protein